jgi:osmotically-inducible protein OsmY
MTKNAFSSTKLVIVTAVSFSWALSCQSTLASSLAASFAQSFVYQTFLRADTIKVDEQPGEIRLSGQVMDEPHRSLAQALAAELAVGQVINNQLVVKMPASENAEALVVSRILAVWALHRSTRLGNPHVGVHDGIAALEGEAATESQRALYGEYARDIPGVRQVENRMTVSASRLGDNKAEPQTIDDVSITAQVKVALQLHRSTRQILSKVVTTNGVVTITGVARNAVEISHVTILATDIVGAKLVLNTMTLAPSLSQNTLKPPAVSNLRIVTAKD